MNAPTPDDHQPTRKALQRDAARVPEPPFDQALHDSTMRRLRALTATQSKSPWFTSWPALASAAAVLAIVLTIPFWPSRSSSHHTPDAVATAVPLSIPPRASLLAYQIAAKEGDSALFITLDHDAADLLPASSPVFNTALQ
jgi:hypothetical protein